MAVDGGPEIDEHLESQRGDSGMSLARRTGIHQNVNGLEIEGGRGSRVVTADSVGGVTESDCDTRNHMVNSRVL